MYESYDNIRKWFWECNIKQSPTLYTQFWLFLLQVDTPFVCKNSKEIDGCSRRHAIFSLCCCLYSKQVLFTNKKKRGNWLLFWRRSVIRSTFNTAKSVEEFFNKQCFNATSYKTFCVWEGSYTAYTGHGRKKNGDFLFRYFRWKL
jgi:hypothetical protein